MVPPEARFVDLLYWEGVVDEFIVTEGVAPYRLYVSVFCFR